ncbi:MAG: hypothetical protein U0166_18455 [Acidobacteriota bacterium]
MARRPHRRRAPAGVVEASTSAWRRGSAPRFGCSSRARRGAGREGKKVRRARKLLGRLARSLSAPRSAQVHYAILDGYKRARRRGASSRASWSRGARLSPTRSRASREKIARFPTEKLVRVLTEAVALASVALSPSPRRPPTMLAGASARRRPRTGAAHGGALPRASHRGEEAPLLPSASGLTGSAEHAAAKEAQGILGDVHDRDEILSWLDGERRRAARLRAMRHARHCQELGAEIERERAAILATLDLDALLHAPADEAEERPA